MNRDNILRVLYAHNKYKNNTQLKLDFDILIMLDSCRYDMFKKIYFNYIDGKLKKYYSCGCDTVSWLKNSANITNPSDFFFISAQPYIDKVKQLNLFGKQVFNYYPAYDRDIDEKSGVVLPETLSAKAIEKLNSGFLDHKRVIIWYVQPHYPYFLPDGTFKADMSEYTKGKISRLEIEWLYNFNLKYVLTNIKSLLSYFSIHNPDYKILISSDHGELFGEKGIYGHPYGVFYNKLQEVPLLEVNL